MRKKVLTVMLILMVLSNSLTVFAAPETMADGTVFDAEYYAQNNPDVVAVFGTDKEALFNHYIMFGKAEGRQASGSTASVADLTDSEILSMYDWDYMGYCGGDTSANRVDIVYQTSSYWEPEIIHMYDNAQYAVDIDTGTLFIYGNGTIWGEDETWPWTYCIPYEPSNYRDDTSVSYIDEAGVYMDYLFRHIIIGHNISNWPRCFIPRYTTDITIYGPIESIDAVAFRCDTLQTVRIPKETKIQEVNGYNYFVGMDLLPATFTLIRQ